MAITLTTTARNAMCDALVDLIDAGSGAGKLVFHDASHAEVATVTCADPAFGSAAGGVATGNTFVADSDCTGGTISHAHFFDSDSTEICALSVTATGGGGDIEVSSLTIGAGDTLNITSFTFTMPAS